MAQYGYSGLSGIRQVFRAVQRPDAEAVLQVGTALPVVAMIDELEAELDTPIVACNAALYWQTLRGIGLDDRLSGYGRLFAEH